MFNILSLIMLFIVASTAWIDVQGASFDCSKAKADVETAICANKELSAFDDSLAEVYRDLLSDHQDTGRLRDQQRAWLLNRMPDCQYQDNVNFCLIEKYKRRIELLKALKALRQPTKSSSSGIQSRYLLDEVSKKHDFVLQLLEKCEPITGEDGGTCEGPGIIGVFHKGAKTPVQLIPMDNIFLSFTKRGKPLANSAALYDYQGVINVGDFNFDGQEDFAIQNGNHGSYSGPSYDVYLSIRDSERFEFNRDFSELIDSTLGFFQFDAERKRLVTFGKSGCCYHETTEYEVVGNKPVPISRVIDQAKGDRSFTHEERWVNGKWARLADEYQHKSTGPVLLLPAPEAPQSDTDKKPIEALHFPGREYKSGTDWWALSCSSTCQIAHARLTVTPKPYVLDDESKVFGQRLNWSPAPQDDALLFLRAPVSVLNLTAGPVITFNPIDAEEVTIEEPTARDAALEAPTPTSLVFVVPNGVRAYVMPMLVLPDSKASHSNGIPALELRIKGQRQTLISDYFSPNDFLENRQSYVPWVGDLDGDGKLDLIVNMNPSSPCGTNIVLFLSSRAKNGQLVGEAGRFDSSQIDQKGCR